MSETTTPDVEQLASDYEEPLQVASASLSMWVAAIYEIYLPGRPLGPQAPERPDQRMESGVNT
jgi:hypothetical protein